MKLRRIFQTCVQRRLHHKQKEEFKRDNEKFIVQLKEQAQLIANLKSNLSEVTSNYENAMTEMQAIKQQQQDKNSKKRIRTEKNTKRRK